VGYNSAALSFLIRCAQEVAVHMSGKSCIIRMHAASAVSDMQQKNKRIVTTKGVTTATSNSGVTPPATTTSAACVQSTHTTSLPSAPNNLAAQSAAPLTGPGGLYGANAKAVNASNAQGTDANNSNGAKPSNHDRIKLPLPPPGIGIRHNVQVVSDVSKLCQGVPRGAPIPLPPPGTGIRHNVQTSEDIATPSRGVPKGAAAYEARVAADASKKFAVPGPNSQTDNKQQNAQGKKKRPATKMDQGVGEADDDSSLGSGSCSNDDGISASSNSYDSDATSDLDDSNSSFSSAGSGPQHDQMKAETESVSPDLEYAVIAHRKKGLLLSRLSEMSVRGTLFVVSAQD
jgi:hypothetical protein